MGYSVLRKRIHKKTLHFPKEPLNAGEVVKEEVVVYFEYGIEKGIWLLI